MSTQPPRPLRPVPPVDVDRVPADDDAERDLLGQFILHPERFAVAMATGLTADCFRRAENRKTFRAYASVFATGQRPDEALVRGLLADRGEFDAIYFARLIDGRPVRDDAGVRALVQSATCGCRRRLRSPLCLRKHEHAWLEC